MPDGLTGKLVTKRFHPGCWNCAQFEKCRAQTPSPTWFPCNLTWPHQHVVLYDQVLVLESQTGKDGLDGVQLGCPDYSVARGWFSEPTVTEVQIMDAWREENDLDAKISEAEGSANPEGLETLYEKLEAACTLGAKLTQEAILARAFALGMEARENETIE